MNFVKAYNKFFQKYFPSPFTIAVLLTGISLLIAFFFTQEGTLHFSYSSKLMNYWFSGLFKSSLLEFTVHMMLILVLGHILALSQAAQTLINFLLRSCRTSAGSIFVLSLFSILLAFFNWGFALVFSAIFARKIGEKFQNEQRALNYPLLVAAAYVCMMVWHGGLSGSAPLAIAGSNHSYVGQVGVISMETTTFGAMNLFNSALILLVIPLSLFLLAKRFKQENIPQIQSYAVKKEQEVALSPAEGFEQKRYLGWIVGACMLLYFVLNAKHRIDEGVSFLSILNLQSTNLLLLGLAMLSHGSFKSFLAALEESIGDVSGILIQFPLYFGIMGIIQESGLALKIAAFFTDIASDSTLAIYTFLSAGLLNIFIPSGGGQWQVQAPIIISSAQNSSVPIQKLIMAMCYGDQLTNLLQPFWALPLLSICQVKAKDILPYCLFIFALGFLIFMTSLIFF